MSGRGSSLVPGIFLAVLVALAAVFLGRAVPVLGAAPTALALGVIVRIFTGESAAAAPGTRWASKRLLKTAVVLLGAGLSLTQISALGGLSFALIVAVVALALVVITWIGRRMQLPPALSSLIAVGTAICGASAVAAASPVVDAKEDETAYALATIFTFNVVALFAYPILGHAFHLSATTFAVWAGTAIHDTASAVAAGYAFSDQAGIYATVVKLARTTLLIPVLVTLAALYGRNRGTGTKVSPLRTFPWFIIGFLALSLVRTLGWIPDSLAQGATDLAKFFIVVALAGVGLGTNLERIRRTGVRPLFLGLAASLFISILSLTLAVQLGL